MVKLMAGLGTPHEHIARKVGVRSPKTLRKYFREELDFGMMEADLKVSKTFFEMATSGKHFGATLAWERRYRRPRADSAAKGRNSALPLFMVAPEPEVRPE